MAVAKRLRSVPVWFLAIWDWSIWGEPDYDGDPGWFIGYAHFNTNIRQYWEVVDSGNICVMRFRDGKRVNLYTVDWDGWDLVNRRRWFDWWLYNAQTRFGLLWDSNNGRTVSLFIDGKFRAELWRDIPPEIYPVFNPRHNGQPGARLHDIPTLENACYKKVTDLVPASVALLPPPFSYQRQKEPFQGLVYKLYPRAG